MSSAEEDDYYSDEEEESEEEVSESESSHSKRRRRKPERKHSKHKRENHRREREKQRKKKDKQKSRRKSEKERKRDKGKKESKSKRRKRDESEDDYSEYYETSEEAKAKKHSKNKHGRRHTRDRKDRRRKREDSTGSYSSNSSDASPHGRARSRSRTPKRGKVFVPPTDLRDFTLAQACEAAGRGDTTGETAKDTDVKVLGPDEERTKAKKFETFEEIRQFPREIRDELSRAGFPAPSQIQSYTWPLGLEGKDIIGIAATGSGKTLAFLLPAFTEMDKQQIRPERTGPGLLVMSPTRELAQQTEQEASRFGRPLGFRCVAMYGGAPKGDQMSRYRAGCHTIVACPGRLNDFLEGGQVRVDSVTTLVLDEADRMLDMGFEPQIRKILTKVPRKRHTLFFTATWPREVRGLADEMCSKPYKVMIGNRDQLKGNQDITQVVRIVDPYGKIMQLEILLREAGLTNLYGAGKALIFCNTKRMCEQLSNDLHRKGFPCASIHGDKDQRQRDEALNSLKTGRIKVLIATDVAARGLDIKGVGLVVNFDPANNPEDYVHRIGRTARAGAKGFAITFLTSADGNKARGIVEVMDRTDQEVGPELRALAGSGAGKGDLRRHRGGGGKGGGGKR